jgi:hypothetical protein
MKKAPGASMNYFLKTTKHERPKMMMLYYKYYITTTIHCLVNKTILQFLWKQYIFFAEFNFCTVDCFSFFRESFFEVT